MTQKDVSSMAATLGRLGGLKGGPARARSLTAAQRKAQATKASKAASKARRRRARERKAAAVVTPTEGAAAAAPN